MLTWRPWAKGVEGLPIEETPTIQIATPVFAENWAFTANNNPARARQKNAFGPVTFALAQATSIVNPSKSGAGRMSPP